MKHLMQYRNLALAAMFTLATLAMPAMRVEAKAASGGANPSGCNVIDPGTGTIKSYAPGTRYVDQNGRKYVCGDDGWFHEVQAVVTSPSGGEAVQPTAPAAGAIS